MKDCLSTLVYFRGFKGFSRGINADCRYLQCNNWVLQSRTWGTGIGRARLKKTAPLTWSGILLSLHWTFTCVEGCEAGALVEAGWPRPEVGAVELTL